MGPAASSMPVYKHLDLIKLGEEFIEQQTDDEKSNKGNSTFTLTSVKGNFTKRYLDKMLSAQRGLQGKSGLVPRDSKPNLKD